MRRTGINHDASTASASPKQRIDSARSFLLGSGWDEKRIARPIKVEDLYVLTVAPANEPRLSVVVGRHDEAAHPASLAYSSESELIVHWGGSRISLGRPTHWQARPGDSPGLAGDATDRWTLEDIFALVGPDKLLSGEAKQVGESGKAHESLAVQLGNSLASLRRDVAEIDIGGESDLDRVLLRFFHQLLYIRILEDRGNGCGRRIAAVYGESEDHELVGALAQAIAGYRDTLNSDLFRPALLPLQDVGAGRLRSLLRSLVVPWQELDLDFSLARADLAGRLYQQYLKKTPAVERAGEGRRPRLLPIAVERDEREQTAAFYTPTSLASLLAADTLGTWLEHTSKRPSEVRVIDPACGSGSFLVAAFRLLKTARESGGSTLRPAQREAILRESIFGADIDGKAVEITQLQLLEAAELSRSRLPDLDQNLFIGDSLYPPGKSEDDVPSDAVPWRAILNKIGRFDAVLMNPPFGAQLRLPRRLEGIERAALRERFPDIRSWGSDLAYYFVSLALELIEDGGCAGMIVPRKLLDGKGARRTREFLHKVARPDRIVDFRGLALFPGAAPYVALLEFLPNRRALEAVDIADSTVDAALALNAIIEDQNRIVRRAKTESAAMGENWTPFALRWREQQLKDVKSDCRRLGDVQEIALHQGTQTGAQQAFTIAEDRWKWADDGQIQIDGLPLDPRFAPFVAWGPDINPLLTPTRRDRLLLPFEDDKSRTVDPDALEMLMHLGGFGGLAQPGAITALRSPKVILRGFSREPAAFADLDAAWITVKGTKGGLVLVPKRDHPDLLRGISALLCSSLYQWLLRGFGQPRHDETIEILQMNAEELPWPDLSHEEWARLSHHARAAGAAMNESSAPAQTFAYRSERAQIDELVFELLEVGPRLRTTINRELVRYL